MRCSFIFASIFLAFTWLTGCSEEPPPVRTQPAGSPKANADPKPAPAPAPAPAPVPVAERSPSSEVTVPASTPTANSVSNEPAKPADVGNPQAKAPASGKKIKLSAGVALPQTMPEGAAMSFSVDYRFTEGLPAATPYVWVIERSWGEPAKVPVTLDDREGNLMTFVPQWRPNEGPFQAHLEDNQGRLLSDTVELAGQ
jgi:hypothetical protein